MPSAWWGLDRGPTQPWGRQLPRGWRASLSRLVSASKRARPSLNSSGDRSTQRLGAPRPPSPPHSARATAPRGSPKPACCRARSWIRRPPSWRRPRRPRSRPGGRRSWRRLPLPWRGAAPRRPAGVGAPVAANQPLVEVADPAALDVVFNLSPAEAALVRAGQAVTVSTGDQPQRDTLGTGVVTGVAFQVDSASRSVAVRARLTRPARALRIGETVAGRIAVGVRGRAVVVPAEALGP